MTWRSGAQPSRRLMFSLFVGEDHDIESNRLTEWGLAPEVSQWQRVKNCLWRMTAPGAKRTFARRPASARCGLAASIPDNVQYISRAECLARCAAQIQIRLCFCAISAASRIAARVAPIPAIPFPAMS
jgi:hypothetical protein